MANTLYTEIYDLFLLRLKDWRLNVLYDEGRGEAALNTYLQGFLILAIPDFDVCTQDLEDRDDVAGQFNITLTTTNKVILSLLMVKKWLDKEIRNIEQMNGKIKDHDFDFFAESQNLKSKTDYSIVLAEEISQKLVDYSYKNIDWEAWYSGNFGG